MTIALTYFPRLRDAQGQRVSTTWRALLERLARPREVAEKHAAPGFSLATYRGDRRALANVERVFAVGLDLDHDVPAWAELVALFAGVDSFTHTTWSSTAAEPRARVFLRLSRPVTGDEYRRVYAAVVERCEESGLSVDRNASDPSRFWFLPSSPPGQRFAHAVGAGRPVHVDGALARAAAPAPTPELPSRPSLPHTAAPDVVDRARAYLERCDPAISGQGGHRQTFVVAQKLVRGFALDDATALSLLGEWNARCQPPWSERELRRKIQQAGAHGRQTPGELRDRDREAS